MITVQNATWVFVGTSAGEVGITNSGTWSFADVLYVSGGTNAPVYFDEGSLRDGTVILVDADGLVTGVNGPDLLSYAMLGAVTAFLTVGVILGIRYVLGLFASAAGTPVPGGD